MPGIVSFETGDVVGIGTDAFLPEVAVTLRERGFRSGLGPPFQELDREAGLEKGGGARGRGTSSWYPHMVSTRSPGRLLARYIHFYIILREPRFLFIFLLLYTLLLCGGDGDGGDGGGDR